MTIDERLMTLNKRKKNRQVTYIAPLQPPTLATFLSWGDSVGAGRIRLAGCKGRTIADKSKLLRSECCKYF
jgi:hypothetical protein